MLKFCRAVIGYGIVGILTMGVWGSLVAAYGLAGGFFAAVIFIGPCWFLLHFLGLVHSDTKSMFVDLGFGVGFAGLFRDFFMVGSDAAIASLPTLAVVLVGGIIGGAVAVLIERDMAKDASSLIEEADEIRIEPTIAETLNQGEE
ncbi:hypothetical protein JZO70_11735 [Enterococcus sp. 669A]|uniref:Uncharacterized protein n=1 Tax=Candidatus Enterococcus moelleringii TaxID=2815325 RepID=A0ABS3LB22_9ENTE|nr:hypothetical protein [Enterococcus sp. 669A]MBO1306838.1 hypothetical protein [Enterococcus sp. 669A]